MSDPTDPRLGSRALPPTEPSFELVPSHPTGVATLEPTPVYVHPAEEETHFWDYWRVLARRRWTVITFFLVTVIVATLWTFTTRPVYTGTATLRIEKDQPHVIKFDEVVKENESQQDYLQTQYRILQSRALANRVIGLLQLDQHPAFQQPESERSVLVQAEAGLREQLVRWIPVPPPPAPEETEDLALASPLTDAFLGRLSIEPVRNTRIVKVSFNSHYPDLAARAPNTLAEAFIAQQLDQKVEATRYATQFLAEQLEGARGKLGQSEELLDKFLRAKDILFVAGDKTGQGQDLVTQQLSLLSDALLKARGERIGKESVVAQASTRDVDSLPAVLQSSAVGQLKQDLANLEGEQRKLGQVFKPDYPRMQQLRERIAESRRQLRAEVDRAVQGLRTDYQAAVQNERELERALTRQRALARGLSESMAEYNLLRRDVDTSRDLYSSLLGRLRETQISAALFTSNIYVVDRAEIPGAPSYPRKARSLLVACVIGLAGGVGLAFLFEYLDTNIKDAKEAEAVLHVPIVGLVPAWASRRRRELVEDNGRPFAVVAPSTRRPTTRRSRSWSPRSSPRTARRRS
ncbi:MAG: hypothetical protein DMD82_15295 [Candidatus Rokuibacteriota bacterium]|nr:MAG: hypothetical protein DMD82_15295 [Candidatus Rokubacteria bacterium]